MLAVCLMFGGAALVNAQDQPIPGQSQTQDQDQQQIAVSELPDNVTSKLESSDYAGWTVGNAFRKMDDSNQEMYVIELRQGTETKKVKFDRDGNEIDKGKRDKSGSSNYRDDAGQIEEPATPEQPRPDQR